MSEHLFLVSGFMNDALAFQKQIHKDVIRLGKCALVVVEELCQF